MKFSLEFDLGNAAFDENLAEAVACVLLHVGGQVLNNLPVDGETIEVKAFTKALLDGNGNTIGSWGVDGKA